MKNIFAKFLFYFVVIVACQFCKGYKILVVFPFISNSHRILGDACVKLLLGSGHQVTYVLWGSVEPHENLTVIDISDVVPKRTFHLEKSVNGERSWDNLHELTMVISERQRRVVEYDQVQALLNDPKEHFDLAILEWLYGEYIVGLAAVFRCPYIWFSSMEPHPLILGLIGEMSNPAYSGLTTFKSIPPFTFIERVKSLWETLSVSFYREFYIEPIEEKHYESLLAPIILKRHGIVPSYNELRYNASLVLGNSHASVGRALSLPAAYKAVGGYHIGKNVERLSKNLKSLMDNATNGVIFFSMGSLIESKRFPTKITEKLLDVFGGLKQTVIWKFEEDLPKTPSNVHISPWVPQESILDHPNCILFISHGGQLSILETIHYGVPMIGVPVFADQQANVKTLVKKGMAKYIDLSFNIAEDLKAPIEQVIGDPKYTQAAKHQSFIYHHTPVSPADELVHWVEHVVKTKGAAHLRSISLIIPWYNRWCLDFVIFLLALVIVFTLIVRRLLRMKVNRFRKSFEKKTQ